MLNRIKRKKRFNIVIWSVFAVICLCSFMPTASVMLGFTLNSVMDTISFILLSLLVIGTSLIMIIAFTKFIKVVKKTHSDSDFNRCYIAVQITGLLLGLVAWATGGVFLFINQGDFYRYELVKGFTVCDMLGFFSTLLNFMIVAYVIYKTSIIAAGDTKDRNERSDEGTPAEQKLTLLEYLRHHYSAYQNQMSDEQSSEAKDRSLLCF